jgi:hypothetical protein
MVAPLDRGSNVHGRGDLLRTSAFVHSIVTWISENLFRNNPSSFESSKHFNLAALLWHLIWLMVHADSIVTWTSEKIILP